MVEDTTNTEKEKKAPSCSRRSMMRRTAGTALVLGGGLAGFTGTTAAADPYQDADQTKEQVYHNGDLVGEVIAVPAGVTNPVSNNLAIGWSFNVVTEDWYGARNENLEVTLKESPSGTNCSFEEIGTWVQGNQTDGNNEVFDALAALGGAIGIPGASLLGLVGDDGSSDVSYPNDRSSYEVAFDSYGLGGRSGGSRSRFYSDGNQEDINGSYEVEYKLTVDVGEEVVKSSPNRVVFEKLETVTQTSTAEFEINV
jgi:hypothetical protein